MPEGIDHALSEELEYSHVLTPIDPQVSASPLELLSAAFEIDLRSARSLAAHPGAAGRAALVNWLDADKARQWDTTLRAFLSDCSKRNRYSATIVVLAEPNAAAGLKEIGAIAHSWQGVVSRTDATLCALSAIDPPGDPLTDRLAAEMAIALCGWDLASVANEAARRAKNHSALFAVPECAQKSATTGRWEDGLCDNFDGVPFANQLVCDPRELRRRLWRGQVAVLFGWLEELRIEFIDSLKLPAENPVRDLYNCEWTWLAVRMRETASHDAADLAESCRRMRNKLAHMQPVSWDDISNVIGQALRMRLGIRNG